MGVCCICRAAYQIDGNLIDGSVFHQRCCGQLKDKVEIVACVLPSANRFYWLDSDWQTALKGNAPDVCRIDDGFLYGLGFRRDECQ